MRTPDLDFGVTIRNEVIDGSLHPAAAIGRLVGQQIETSEGLQPAFFVVPSAVPVDEYRPGIPMTLADDHLRMGPFRQVMPYEDGGIRVYFRATTDPFVGACAVSNFNVPAQRMIEQGAGVNSSNYTQLSHGSNGYAYFGGDTAKLYVHPLISDFARSNPYKTIGYSDILLNDGSFKLIPTAIAGPKQYYSEGRQSTLLSLPVNGKALGALGIHPLVKSIS